MGAGKKESDNSFTGLLLGDLPRVENVDHTGILGYEHGEPSYGIFDDGTAFLGKSSRAQLRFDGTNGYIKNTGYDYGEGIKIDFDGGIEKSKVTNGTTAQSQKPYIDMKALSGAEVYLSTDGGKNTPYFQVSGKKEDDSNIIPNLMHISDDAYYLQDNERAHNRPGLKIDLMNGSFDSTGQLTITGDTRSYIDFGDGNFHVDGDGILTAKEFNFADAETGEVTIIKPKWMTFVTDVSGTIEKGTVSISATVSDTVTVPYSYQTQTVSVGDIADTANFIGSSSPQLSGSSYISERVIPIYGEEDRGVHHLTVHNVVTKQETVTKYASTNYLATITGTTNAPVVKNIILHVKKISMWALTNEDVETTDVTISGW